MESRAKNDNNLFIRKLILLGGNLFRMIFLFNNRNQGGHEMRQKDNQDIPLSASVPSNMEALFKKAQKQVDRYFAASEIDVAQGILRIGGNRHFILRGDALSIEFFKLIRTIYGDSLQTNDIANALLFDLSHAIGSADAEKFIDTMGLADSVERFSVGPIYFAYTGFARVVVDEKSHMTPDDDFVLYFRHENSFEAESWKKNDKKPEKPVCVLNSGYASGWCSTAFGIPLISVEYACEALGDEGCDFIVAPPHRINEYLGRIPNIKHSLYVPHFFGRREHEEHMRTLAYRDSLTNLSNRAFFSEMGQKILNFACRNDQSTGLLFLDLDGFKGINDNYGHAAGDRVLKVVAERLAKRFRSNDLITRLGGDEFAVLMQESVKQKDLEVIAQDLIDTIGEPIEYNGYDCHVGVSIGGVYFKILSDTTLNNLLDEADAAMYEAKRAGKNCFRIKQIKE